MTMTAIAYLPNSRLNEDALPWHVAFGVRFEDKAWQMSVLPGKCVLNTHVCFCASFSPKCGVFFSGMFHCSFL